MDRLSTLPTELHLSIFSYLDSMDDMRNLANTSRLFYILFDEELYKESGRRFSWLPLFIGAQKGDIKLLERCQQAGAPLDTTWQLTNTYVDIDFSQHCRPIHVAVQYRKLVAVNWFLELKNNDNGYDYITERGDFKSPLEWALHSSGIDAKIEKWSVARRQKAGLVNTRIFEALLEKSAHPKDKIAEYGHLLRRVMSVDTRVRHGIPFLTLLVQKGVNLNVLCDCWDPCALNPLPGRKERLQGKHFQNIFRPVTAMDIIKLIWNNKLCPTTLSYMDRIFDSIVYWSLEATEETHYRRQDPVSRRMVDLL